MKHWVYSATLFQLLLPVPYLVHGFAFSERLKYAVLVDAENAQYSSIGAIVEEIVALGGDSPVRRMYGDFCKPNLLPWKKTSLDCSFMPINAFSYVSGKGTSDAAMIIDAMELLYTNPSIDGYALVSSDSDFTRLAQKLREAGKHVVGFGSKSTPLPFVTACERFIYIENLYTTSKNDTPDSSPDPLSKNDHSDPIPQLREKDFVLLQKTVNDVSNEQGWALLSSIGDALTALKSDFDVRNYGYKKLGKLIFDHDSHFQVQLADDKTTYYVRNRIPTKQE
jgi:hypothetical protein